MRSHKKLAGKIWGFVHFSTKPPLIHDVQSDRFKFQPPTQFSPENSYLAPGFFSCFGLKTSWIFFQPGISTQVSPPKPSKTREPSKTGFQPEIHPYVDRSTSGGRLESSQSIQALSQSWITRKAFGIFEFQFSFSNYHHSTRRGTSILFSILLT